MAPAGPAMMRNPRRFNRLASLAILPILVLTIVLLNRAVDRPDEPGEPPTAGRLVVANLRDESLAFFTFEGDRVVESRLALPGPPHELLAVDGRLYVTLGRANLLVEVEPAAPGILRTLSLEGEPHGLAYAGGVFYVTLDRANELVAVDQATFSALARYPAGDTPHAVAVAGEIAYVTGARDGTVRAIDLGAGTATVLSTGALPESVAIVGDTVAVASAHAGTLTIAARPGLQPAWTIPVGAEPIRVVAFDGRTAVVALMSQDAVAVVDVVAAEVHRTVDMLARPDGLCVDVTGRYLAVVANGADAATIFDADGWRPALTVRTPAGPGACAWLP